MATFISNHFHEQVALRQRILCRALPLYWAFMPDESIVDHAVIESWQWKLCWDLAAFIEEELCPQPSTLERA